MVLKQKKSCNNCNHLWVINKNKLYAVCDEWCKAFPLWGTDTREENCDDWVARSATHEQWRPGVEKHKVQE